MATQAQNNRLTLHLKQASLGRVFELVQQQSEYIIFYKDNQVDLSHLVTIDSENQEIENVLKQALKKTGLKWYPKNKTFIRKVRFQWKFS